jgi:tight adherence protein C
MFRLLLPMAGMFRPWVRHPSLAKTLNETDSKLVQGGLDQNLRAEDFLALRAIYVIFFTGLGACFMIFGTLIDLRPYVFFGIFLMLYGLVYPVFWLRSIIRARHKSIQRALPNVLDLLTLSVEAGRDFLTGLRDILRNRPKDPLGDELERVFRETQLGKPRRQALRDMADRVQQSDLTSVVETLAQADELGVSIGHILRILGEQMRQKRVQAAEKLANESPVKLMLPLFLFIFPAVLLVIFGPILLRFPLTL